MVPPEIVAQIIALIGEGNSRRSVARRFNLHHNAVDHIYKRYVETGSFNQRPRSGRPRVTDVREDRRIERAALKSRTSTSTDICREINADREKPISSRTVRRRLQEKDLRSCRPATGPVLSRRHRRARLAFAQGHKYWTVDDWSQVLFTDESRFSLQGPDGRQRVWRKPGERYKAGMFSTRSNFYGGSVMVWGGISYHAKTELHTFGKTSVTANSYISDILLDYVVPFAPYIGDRFLLMQDNARPHVAKLTVDFLESTGIRRLEWPACSPDLNPIEHVWDMLGRRIRSRTPPPTSLSGLKDMLLAEWDRIPQHDIQRLIESMPRRCKEVIRARGGNTRY